MNKDSEHALHMIQSNPFNNSREDVLMKVFECCGQHSVGAREETYISGGGVVMKRTAKARQIDGEIAEKLALILSWVASGYSAFFWREAAENYVREQRKS